MGAFALFVLATVGVENATIGATNSVSTGRRIGVRVVMGTRTVAATSSPDARTCLIFSFKASIKVARRHSALQPMHLSRNQKAQM